ncbi:MAG TPA: UDP-N-acetylmuramoyl-tripeptide--D-alanyl-D-alanine ligase [Candidatus Paceibacterota bacterium]|nr:UDP-N-acetylmuramoyl-tripeptide--D-alanyl-D-alanine ligase [Candidatus Paceibacterota bacterium]
MIVGITGNAGKTSTREAVAAVLRPHKKIRVAASSLNNEFGLALTVLGDWDQEYLFQGPSLGLWWRVFWRGVVGVFSRNDMADVLILEYGADHPGDIRRLAAAVPPHVSVVTTVGETPVHVEFFKDADALAGEKSNLVSVLKESDFAILNNDDRRVLEMRAKTKARPSTYGFAEGSDIRVSDFEFTSNEEGKPTGAAFKIHGGNSFVPVIIKGSLGKSQAYAAAAAAAVGTALGLNLVEIGNGLASYQGPKGRLKILSGIKNSSILDDTYNASPASTRLALETLRDLVGLRKIAVLGDMLELGEYSVKAHEEIGELVSACADILVTVGSKGKLIADAALKNMSAENVYSFDTSDQAKSKVQEIIKEYDLVLVKGSQGARMEKVVEEIMAQPEKKEELLVRQSLRWQKK